MIFQRLLQDELWLNEFLLFVPLLGSAKFHQQQLVIHIGLFDSLSANQGKSSFYERKC